MDLLLSWLILSFAVWITAAVLPGFHVKSLGSALFVAAIFGILNFLLGWLLFAIFTVATLGIAWLLAFITRWIINAILLILTARLTNHSVIVVTPHESMRCWEWDQFNARQRGGVRSVQFRT